MALPPMQLPPRGPCALAAPQLLQPLLLPENFYPRGLQRAPCGCFFDPRVFHIQWTSINLPAPATTVLGHGAASLPGAALWGPGGCGTPLAWAAPGIPQGQLQHLAPYTPQGRAVAPAPLLLPTSVPGLQRIEGQPAWISTSGTATPAGAPPGSDVPASPSAAPPSQALGDLEGDLEVSEELLLQEALRLFECSLDALGISQEGPSSGPMPGDAGGTGREGRAVAPAALVLPSSVPGLQPVEGQPARISTSGTATPAGAPPGSDVPPSQALGDPGSGLAVSQEVPLEEALRLFDCSLDMLRLSPEGPSSGPVPGDPPGTSAAIPPRDFASLSLPEELLTPDYSVPEIADAILSLEEFNTIGMEPPEPWGDVGMDLPPSQPAVAEKRGKKQGKSTLAKPPSKRRALAASTGGAGGD